MDTSTKFGGQSVDPGEVLLILVGGILNMVIMPVVNQREQSGCHKRIYSLGTKN